MASPDSEERIRDLEERMAAMPGSRLFVGLAEEYRRAGRYEDAMNTLKKGLEGHPTYLSAQISLARLYQETWRTQEAIEAFSKVLSMDRENLVAAKALSELYESSQNPVEAIKKLKLYRAISGDRAIDEKILRMEALIHPPEEPDATMALRLDDLSLSPGAAPAPPFDPNETVNIFGAAVPEYPAPEPPVEFAASAIETGSPSPGGPSPSSGPPPSPLRAALQTTSQSGRAETSEPGEEGSGEGAGALSVSPREFPEPREGGPGEGASLASRLPISGEEDLRPTEETSVSGAEPRELAGPAATEDLPPSRTLADLYYKQGFVEDARKIYEKLAVANPMDESVTRRLTVLRKPSRRRAARLESWLAGIRSRAGAGRA